VNTVTGTLDTDELGFTLMHEHLVVVNQAMRRSFPGWFDREIAVEQAVEALRAAKACGVDTIVDATPINLGRDIAILQEVSERAKMPIIAATGFYWNDEPWMEGWEPDRLAEWLLRDLTDGIGGTSSKAGIIKCGTDRYGVTPENRKLLEVAARLHLATGVPITTHTFAATRSGPAQQDVFEEEGVDLSRVVIGHCGDTTDVAYLEAILRRGSYIGMDRFAHAHILPMSDRVATIAELCRRGWAKRMVLGHDGFLYIDWGPQLLARHQRGEMPLPFCTISNAILPALRAAGVTEEQIRLMTIANPRRVFGG
jgi:phosphotriesterase-related protein